MDDESAGWPWAAKRLRARIAELEAEVAQMKKIIQRKDGSIMDYHERTEKAEAALRQCEIVAQRNLNKLQKAKAEVAHFKSAKIYLELDSELRRLIAHLKQSNKQATEMFVRAEKAEAEVERLQRVLETK